MLRERLLTNEQAVLEEARARRSDDRSERLQREPRSAEDNETARVESAALTLAISALSSQMPPAEK